MTNFRTHANWACTSLASAYAAGSGTLAVAAGTGALFGSPSAAHPIAVTVVTKAAAYSGAMGAANATIYLCTAVSGDTLTVSVAEGTTDRNYAVGDVAFSAPTAADVNQLATAVNALEAQAPGMAGGRLSLSATNPVADVASGATLYYLPYTGRYVLLYNDTLAAYELVPIAAVASVPLAAYTPNTNYDLFIQNQGGGAAQIAPVAWSGANTRATAITAADGMWFLGTSVPNKNRYVGTIRATGSAGSGTSQDTAGLRYVWNLYNQVRKRLAVAVADSQWTNSTTSTSTWAWRPLANNAANVAWVVSGMTNGWGGPTVDLTATAWIGPVSSGTFALGVMRNGMSQPSHVWTFAAGATGNISLAARWADQAPLGQASYGPYEGILATSGTASYTGFANGGGMEGTYTC